MDSIEIKICGLTNRDDAVAALDFGADYLGFILYSKSPRGITASKLADILGHITKPFNAIAVFVNEQRKSIEAIAGDCGLYAVQLHGDEKPENFAELPFKIWRAVKYVNNAFAPSPEKWNADRFLVDAAVKGKHGGTGVKADWVKAAELAAKYPVMLSGGLNPENVAEAVRAVKPLGVDAATGIESSPCKKDLKKMKRFIQAVKAATA